MRKGYAAFQSSSVTLEPIYNEPPWVLTSIHNDHAYNERWNLEQPKIGPGQEWAS